MTYTLQSLPDCLSVEITAGQEVDVGPVVKVRVLESLHLSGVPDVRSVNGAVPGGGVLGISLEELQELLRVLLVVSAIK